MSILAMIASCHGKALRSYQCPHPSGTFRHADCSKFWHCSNGIPVEKQCPAGLHFVELEWPLEGFCDFPENAGCQEGGQTTAATTGGTEAVTDEETEATEAEETTEAATEETEAATEEETEDSVVETTEAETEDETEDSAIRMGIFNKF